MKFKNNKLARTNNLRTTNIIFFLVLVMLIGLVSAHTTLIVENGNYFEDFESGVLGNWTIDGVGNQWAIDAGGEGILLAGSAFHAYVENTDGETNMTLNISTVDYSNINFSFYSYTTSLYAGEYIIEYTILSDNFEKTQKEFYLKFGGDYKSIEFRENK